MTQKIQKFYRVSEVVQLLGVSQTTVYRMVTEGRLTLVKVGKRASAVPADSLREFMDKASTSANVAQGAEAVRALFQPWPEGELGPTDEPESQYRLGYNTAIEDALDALTAAQSGDKS